MTESTRVELLAEPVAEGRRRLAEFCAARGEPAYRALQIERWIWERAARSFDEATNLPSELRTALDDAFSLTPIEEDYVARSRDGTIKHLWRLEDGDRVESVLIPAGDRLTLCLSSQAGCALGCRFCATGYFGFRRQLRAAEIVAQYRESLRVAREALGRPTSRPISNVVYMGMGEPLANLDSVIASLAALHAGFGVGARRITVSTVGLVPGILELARRPEPFELAISLHAPHHELRLELMPIERRYPLPELFDALRTYQRYNQLGIHAHRRGERRSGARRCAGGSSPRADLLRESHPVQPHCRPPGVASESRGRDQPLCGEARCPRGGACRPATPRTGHPSRLRAAPTGSRWREPAPHRAGPGARVSDLFSISPDVAEHRHPVLADDHARVQVEFRIERHHDGVRMQIARYLQRRAETPGPIQDVGDLMVEVFGVAGGYDIEAKRPETIRKLTRESSLASAIEDFDLDPVRESSRHRLGQIG